MPSRTWTPPRACPTRVATSSPDGCPVTSSRRRSRKANHAAVPPATSRTSWCWRDWGDGANRPDFRQVIVDSPVTPAPLAGLDGSGAIAGSPAGRGIAVRYRQDRRKDIVGATESDLGKRARNVLSDLSCAKLCDTAPRWRNCLRTWTPAAVMICTVPREEPRQKAKKMSESVAAQPNSC